MKTTEGYSIIEIILAIAIFVIISSSAVVAILGALTTIRLTQEQGQATYLANEGMEAIKSIRDQQWASLIPGNTYGLSKTSGVWSFSGTSDTNGKYTRSLAVSAVNRSGGAIVTSGGTVDFDTKKVTCTVSWNAS